MLTKKQKLDLIKLLEMVDVKKLDINHDNPEIVKWFRFGSYNGLAICKEIIKASPETSAKNKSVKIKNS